MLTVTIPPAGTVCAAEVPAILAQKSVRDAVYVHFPHGSETQEVGIPGFWPATWVRKGDWKLVRYDLAAEGSSGTSPVKLYNLKDDVGEARDLAATHPEKVKELIAANTDKATVGLLGEDGGNVLKLNLARDALKE